MISDNTYDIEVDQFKLMKQEEYFLIDLRDEVAFNHGCIPGATNISMEKLESSTDQLPFDKKIVVYCMKGIIGKGVTDQLLEKGYDAYNLSGGYGSWLVDLFD